MLRRARLQTEVVKSLLAHKANPRAGAMDDMLPLHFAAQKGHTEVCRLLINEGALMIDGLARTWSSVWNFVAWKRHLACSRGTQSFSRFAVLINIKEGILRDPTLILGALALAGHLLTQWCTSTLRSALVLIGQASLSEKKQF